MNGATRSVHTHFCWHVVFLCICVCVYVNFIYTEKMSRGRTGGLRGSVWQTALRFCVPSRSVQFPGRVHSLEHLVLVARDFW